ncbi:2,3-oxidosqualene cyclase [Corallococcus exercitus]|uniref:2,3-oxidosqualene cyclase n=1 Tax=Corallococcus exercitus TaxID=2316736 RepID=A0A7Y4KG90_9BACT|nr:2,3-oxidosqualene cyclase [Corallococcus exercitus]NOK33273.1 2,3-oxidosqualene cyclase [Corallococcus exercitus]
MRQARDVLARTQEADGSWKGDYSGPLFLAPVYVAGLYVMGRSPDARLRDGLVAYMRARQGADGGWGLDVESPGLVFTTVLNYVAQRLLGVGADDPGLLRARTWFLPRGGPLGSASWGKFVLALLGLYEYEGLAPVPPELWLLPRALPFHPSRLWCHCRMVYLPMGWLYGRRARARETPLLAELRRELYPQPYADVDWKAARGRVAATDAYTPHGLLLRAVHRVLGLYERFHSKRLRARALEESLALIRGEDAATHSICIGPINKVFNTVVWHVARPDGPEVRAHLERLPDYLQPTGEGITFNGYNSSQLWDTAFAVQALVASGATAGARDTLERAGRFLAAQQVLEDSPDAARHHRHPSRGGWPFSTREHGWPISDCTAEALKACLLLEPLGLNRVPHERLEQAVAFILSLQNRDGGWATYERQRGPRWLERFNPSDVFAGIMVDPSYVECTSACVQALAAWRKAHPEAPVGRAIARGADFLRRQQRPDGSWEGAWGVCFSYGTWFGVTGLVAAGAKAGDPALRGAVAFLKAHQREDGSWSETIQGCRERRWVEGRTGHAVTTSWAVLSLVAAGDGEHDATKRGVAWLRATQGPHGQWPPEPLAGVFSRTCAIHYDAYLRIFPLWALSLAEATGESVTARGGSASPGSPPCPG